MYTYIYIYIQLEEHLLLGAVGWLIIRGGELVILPSTSVNCKGGLNDQNQVQGVAL